MVVYYFTVSWRTLHRPRYPQATKISSQKKMDLDLDLQHGDVVSWNITIEKFDIQVRALFVGDDGTTVEVLPDTKIGNPKVCSSPPPPPSVTHPSPLPS